MSLETGTLIKDLIATNPAPGDNKSEGDDHLRLLKRVLKAQFPNLEGAVTQTAAQLNRQNYGINPPYMQIQTAEYPMLEWHRPGFSAYAAYIDKGSNRLYFTTSNGSGGAGAALMSLGSEGRMDVYNSLTVGGNTRTASLTMANGTGALTMAFEQAGTFTRYLHRNGDLMGFLNGSGGWATWSANNGDLWSAGNVFAYSDERVKKNWRKIPKTFLTHLSKVKSGTYTRKDTGERQMGVSAQSLQDFAPEAVSDGHGQLGVAYGNVALVACVELAKQLLTLQAEMAALKKSLT